MLEDTRKAVPKILDTQREDRRIFTAKRKKMNTLIKGLRNRVAELEKAQNDDENKSSAAAGAKSKAKQIKNIIREQGKYYKMISEVSSRDSNGNQ